MRKTILVVGVFLLLGILPSGNADVFKWIDDAGNVHYGDSPPEASGSERMELRVDVPDASDEAELRRLRALQQADEAAKARLQQRITKKNERENSKRQIDLAEERCMELRRQLDILKYQMPAYRDENGKYRVKWEEDYYDGRREYVDDATRERLIKQMRSQIVSQCAHQDDLQADREAHRQNVFSEKCAAARVKLRLTEDPERRASDSAIEARRKEVQHYCGE